MSKRTNELTLKQVEKMNSEQVNKKLFSQWTNKAKNIEYFSFIDEWIYEKKHITNIKLKKIIISGIIYLLIINYQLAYVALLYDEIWYKSIRVVHFCSCFNIFFAE